MSNEEWVTPTTAKDFEAPSNRKSRKNLPRKPHEVTAEQASVISSVSPSELRARQNGAMNVSNPYDALDPDKPKEQTEEELEVAAQKEEINSSFADGNAFAALEAAEGDDDEE